MQPKKRQINPSSTRKFQIFGLGVLSIFLIASLLYDTIFIDRLVPVTCIILLIAFIHNLGERT